MSIDSISAVNSQAVQPNASTFKQRKQDFDALAQALQSGDLSGAQTAFAAFQNDIASARPAASSTPQAAQTAPTSFQDTLNTIGQALNSGDIASAQKAFATFLQNVQNHGGRGHHHHGGGAQVSNVQPTTTPSGPTPSIDTTA